MPTASMRVSSRASPRQRSLPSPIVCGWKHQSRGWEQEVVVQFTERLVSYDYADLSELALAWAVTVHKSQGSEYPVVIFPLFMQHYVLLSRNLLYTGLTRAKQLAILVGPTKAIGFSIK